MIDTNYISNYCKIKDGKIFLDGTCRISSVENEMPLIFKSFYNELNLNYRKFFKMDSLSKLAFLAAEMLLKNTIDTTEENNIAVILSNNASSLDTDRKHQESIADSENYYPSPAVFVYTLPNICIGEICIRHRLFSENSFFIFENFSGEHLFDYANSLISSNKSNKVLCGWVNVDEENYEAFMYLVSKDKSKIEHTTKEINRLYQQL